jgi:Uncharacterized protein conserved in cyanobacteria
MILLESRTDFEVFNSDTKIYMPKLQIYYYPDALVVAGAPIESEYEIGAILNPILIVEVLSEATGRHDRLVKFNNYQSIPSFREYVLIHQDRPQIDAYLREQEPDLWRSSKVSGLEPDFHFQSIGVQVPMSKIYRNVSFETLA